MMMILLLLVMIASSIHAVQVIEVNLFDSNDGVCQGFSNRWFLEANSCERVLISNYRGDCAAGIAVYSGTDITCASAPLGTIPVNECRDALVGQDERLTCKSFPVVWDMKFHNSRGCDDAHIAETTYPEGMCTYFNARENVIVKGVGSGDKVLFTFYADTSCSELSTSPSQEVGVGECTTGLFKVTKRVDADFSWIGWLVLVILILLGLFLVYRRLTRKKLDEQTQGVQGGGNMPPTTSPVYQMEVTRTQQSGAPNSDNFQSI